MGAVRIRGLASAVLMLGAAASGARAHEGVAATLRDLDAAVAAHPEDAEIRFRRGELHRLAGDLPGARADYLAARRIDPGLAIVDLGLAHAELEGDAEAALRDAGAYLACVPGSAEGERVRGRALALLGRGSDAAAAWQRAIDLCVAPREPLPEDFLERARLLAGEGDVDGALACLESGLGRLGPAVTLHMAALDLEIASGRSRAAIARLEALASRSERREPWRVREARLFEQLGMAGEARRAYLDARDSLASVPAARRSAPATQRLERQIREGLDRLASRSSEKVP